MGFGFGVRNQADHRLARPSLLEAVLSEQADQIERQLAELEREVAKQRAERAKSGMEWQQ